MRKRLLASSIIIGSILFAVAAPTFAAGAPIDPALQVPKTGVRKTQQGMVHSVSHRGNVTEIVIHDKPRPKKMSPGQGRNFEEVSVQAPRLQAVPRYAPPPPGYAPQQTAYAPPANYGPVWTQDYEPGPASQAAANVGPSYGVNILPTQAYYYGPGVGYGPGQAAYGPGYPGGGYGPNSGNYRQGYHRPAYHSTYHSHSGHAGPRDHRH